MRTAVCVMVLVFACGCAGVPSWQDAGDYLYDRGNDFLDCFQANVGVGCGLAANVKVTDWITYYLGGSRTYRAGLGRRFIQAWREQEGGILLLGERRVLNMYGYDVKGERKHRRGDYLGERLSSFVLVLPVDICSFGSHHRYSASVRPLVEQANLEVGATLGVVAARVGVSPGQMIDFVQGWFGVDTPGDDRGVGWRTKEEGKGGA